MTRTAILGTGAYAPEKVLTNADLEKMVETSDAWITERTGIKERRIAAPGELTSDMAVKAAIRALEMARTRPDELDLIVMGTVSPDMPMPSSAVAVQAKLGAKKAFAFENAAFLDAGALGDPRIGRVDHGGEFGVGEHVVGQMPEHAGDRGPPDRGFRWRLRRHRRHLASGRR